VAREALRPRAAKFAGHKCQIGHPSRVREQSHGLISNLKVMLKELRPKLSDESKLGRSKLLTTQEKSNSTWRFQNAQRASCKARHVFVKSSAGCGSV